MPWLRFGVGTVNDNIVFGLFVAVVGVIGTARVTKLLTEDMWPPVHWLRSRWLTYWGESGWAELFICPFCMSVWVAAANMGIGYATNWPLWWLLVNGWLTVAYVAAMIVARDIPDADNSGV